MKNFFYSLLIFPLFLFGQQTVGLMNNQQNSFNGYTIITPLRSTNTYLIDNCGNRVHEWQSNYPLLGAELLNNGELIRSIFLPNDSISFGGTTGGIEIVDSIGEEVLEINICSDSLMSHHHFEVLPNGNILVLAVEVIDSVDVINSGSLINEKRYAETILEIDRESLDVVWEWRSWDHIIQDVSSEYPNYGVIADHPERININYFTVAGPDWLHFNSIDYNEELDQIMVSTPHFNELWIIDHSTSTLEASTSSGGNSNKGGDLLYRWGNPTAYDRGSETDQKLDFQHDCSWIDSGLPNEGKIMIFNNGSDRGYSSVDMIDPYVESNDYTLSDDSTFLPLIQNVVYSDTANFFSARVSSAQQLENGNIFICSGWEGRIFEIENQTNSVVWDYQLPFLFQFGTSTLVSQGDILDPSNSLIFQSKRYSPSYEAFNYIDLVSSSPIELNPILYDCQIYLSGCINTEASNFDTNANTDDGSCISWQEMALDLESQLNNIMQNNEFSQADIDSVYALGVASVDITSDNQNAFDDGVASVEITECDEVSIHNIPLILPQGWSMFGYTCMDSVDAMVGFSAIADKIETVKDEWGLAYLPQWGFSALDNLEFGEGYQIKMIEEVTDFQFCPTIVGN
jgi:hypothetical protein